MAYDSTFVMHADAPAADATGLRREFTRSGRLVVLAGATGFGAVLGFSATIATGRADLMTSLLIAAPMLAVALYLAGHTLTDALARDARGCATATGLHVAALLAWPMTSLLSPFMAYWIAPLAAISALVMFASCWGGPPRAVYRMAGQGALVAALAAHQAALVIMLG